MNSYGDCNPSKISDRRRGTITPTTRISQSHKRKRIVRVKAAIEFTRGATTPADQPSLRRISAWGLSIRRRRGLSFALNLFDMFILFSRLGLQPKDYQRTNPHCSIRHGRLFAMMLKELKILSQLSFLIEIFGHVGEGSKKLPWAIRIGRKVLICVISAGGSVESGSQDACAVGCSSYARHIHC